jgi:hypothetical protein
MVSISPPVLIPCYLIAVQIKRNFPYFYKVFGKVQAEYGLSRPFGLSGLFRLSGFLVHLVYRVD